MKSQKEVFQSSEGDQWYLRNKALYSQTKDDKGFIIRAVEDIQISPGTTLEVGCSNGLRLHNFHTAFGSECYGLDPSEKAIENGRTSYPHLNLQVGTADDLPFDDNSFDTIIFGFCLYLCDRKDLFKIAFEADRCLRNGGYMIVKDFQPPFAYKNTYVHKSGVFSFKMNHAKLFNWNPAYSELFNVVFTHYGFEKRAIHDEKIAVTIMQKDLESAYPTDPYKE